MIVDTVRETLTPYPAVLRELGQYLATRHDHPLRLALAGGRDISFLLRQLDSLLDRGRVVDGFQRLARKLGKATNNSGFLDFVTELRVCVRLLRAGCPEVEVLDPEVSQRTPDFLITVNNHDFYVEVTRIHGAPERQRTYLRRLKRLTAEITAVRSPFYVTFYPHADYDDQAIVAIVQQIRRRLEELTESGIHLSSNLVSFHSNSPSFTIHISSKGKHLGRRAETIFTIGADHIFFSEDSREERMLLDKVSDKYGQLVPNALNILAIHLSSNVIEEMSQDLSTIFDSPRPKLSGVLLLSDWSPRNRIFSNPAAQPRLPQVVLDLLTKAAALEYEG